MDLVVDSIELLDFRNYEVFKSGEFSRFNVFVGHNGAGKTNIIEAIQLMTSQESFRNPKWDEVVRWGCDRSCVKTSFKGEQRSLDLRLDIANRKRTYYLNDKKKSTAEIRGLLPSVLFCPDDLRIVKGSAENRRDALDYVGTQISNTYYDLKSRYIKAVKQKNALLQSNDFNPALLDPWNENIATIGASFVKHRLNLFETFGKNLVRIWLEMVKNSVMYVVYIPSWEVGNDVKIISSDYSTEQIKSKLLEKAESLKEAELGSRRTLSGPHRDEIRFYIDDFDARKFASQGQQRFIALSWKIAEMETISEICGQKPILLLDDVLSELDMKKRDILAGYLLENMQTFITATDVDYLDDSILQRAQIFEVGG